MILHRHCHIGAAGAPVVNRYAQLQDIAAPDLRARLRRRRAYILRAAFMHVTRNDTSPELSIHRLLWAS